MPATTNPHYLVGRLAGAVETAVHQLRAGLAADALAALEAAQDELDRRRAVASPCWCCGAVAKLGALCEACGAQQPPY